MKDMGGPNGNGPAMDGSDNVCSSPYAPNILQVSPVENTNPHPRNVSDYPSYKKLHSTLPAAVLAALTTRVRTGEPKAIQELWDRRDKTFLAIDFEWSERNQKSCLEWGYAAVRCGHLEACVCFFLFSFIGKLIGGMGFFRVGHWPPNPDTNYRCVCVCGSFGRKGC